MSWFVFVYVYAFFYDAESGYVVQAGHKLQIFLLAQSLQDRNDPAILKGPKLSLP